MVVNIFWKENILPKLLIDCKLTESRTTCLDILCTKLAWGSWLPTCSVDTK